ncbi:pimeloyl-[acyl-carrier protein] methyl ester esterase [Marinobacterium nitratireducens]|uniref:Pimeloyl-[acyl-carrier protein] methyl ester esterase n=1 Tax=Marinobacterium nitratireducens TaxID=518897 RepID=A0A917ZRL7_9GAMM|nr:pimeloyl-ACP methyl ester esterase BioH [Marinobacterium nitratireducens]GGO88918.1 pimeloyl-[acyl-carrier protein] methyl ester esterase [Marinobacterium nitratireducens]
MRLHSERSACSGECGGPTLVLLHGWGLGSDVWAPLLEPLQPHFEILRFDLPGLGRSAEFPTPYRLESVAAAVLEQVPESAIWLGWSLGGLVAAEAARQAPHRVRGLVTVASNPCFVARADWPCAMAPEVFDDFVARLDADPARTLGSFAMLQTQGALGARASLRLLKTLIASLEPSALAPALQLLAEDRRETLAQLELPMLHVFGAEDRLVPAAIVERLGAQLPHASLRCYEGAGHLPFHSHADRFCEDLRQFAGGLR